MSTELEEKIAKADRVDLHYRPPFEIKYAVVRYYCGQGKPYGELRETSRQGDNI